jgi:hypothetical protein
MTGSAAFFRASNLIVMDYPFSGALASALSICDEACVVVGQSIDETRELVYLLQEQYGRDRVKIREERFVFDRGWQERWWDWCREMTTADWHMYHDADESLPDGAVEIIRPLMERRGVQAIVLPYIHFYGTASYRTTGLKFSTHNARIGRKSAGYRMRNWCSDATPKHAACAMVLARGGQEVDAHNIHDAGVEWIDVPLLHYGWCRSPQALAISQAKHYAWYANGGGLQDGHVPLVASYDFRLADRINAGDIGPYKGRHPVAMRSWLAGHMKSWRELEDMNVEVVS